MVLFNYINKEQNISLNFGMKLKKYFAHQQKDLLMDEVFRKQEDLDDNEKLDREISEGVYTFLPEWNNS